jgi:hypothetical protein
VHDASVGALVARDVDYDTPAKIENEEHENRSKPSIVGLHEVTSPCHMVLQERRPALSVAGISLPSHVSLNRSRQVTVMFGFENDDLGIPNPRRLSRAI